MASRTSLEIIRTLITICGDIFSVTHLRFNEVDRIRVLTPSRIRAYLLSFWNWAVVASTFLTCLGLFWDIHKSEQDLVVILVHSVVLLTKLAVASFMFALQLKADDVGLLLNWIMTTSETIIRSKANLENQHDRLLAVLICICVTFSILFLFGIPMASYLCRESLYTAHVAENLVICIEILCMTCQAWGGTLCVCLALVILQFMQLVVCHLIYLLQLANINEVPTQDHSDVVLLYRSLQIFNQICNDAFRNFVWAVSQFLGAAALILCQISLIVFHKTLGSWMIGFSILLLFAGWTYTSLVFHEGSKPVRYSQRFLQVAGRDWLSSALLRRYHRSCPVISVRIGDFHKIDRKRGPDLVRFILQRTAFLVANVNEM